MEEKQFVLGILPVIPDSSYTEDRIWKGFLNSRVAKKRNKEEQIQGLHILNQISIAIPWVVRLHNEDRPVVCFFRSRRSPFWLEKAIDNLLCWNIESQSYCCNQSQSYC